MWRERIGGVKKRAAEKFTRGPERNLSGENVSGKENVSRQSKRVCRDTAYSGKLNLE